MCRQNYKSVPAKSWHMCPQNHKSVLAKSWHCVSKIIKACRQSSGTCISKIIKACRQSPGTCVSKIIKACRKSSNTRILFCKTAGKLILLQPEGVLPVFLLCFQEVLKFQQSLECYKFRLPANLLQILLIMQLFLQLRFLLLILS